MFSHTCIASRSASIFCLVASLLIAIVNCQPAATLAQADNGLFKTGVLDVETTEIITVQPAKNLAACLPIYDEHVKYTFDKLSQSVTSKYPFEHIVIHDIFHPDIYKCMIAHLPRKGANYGFTQSKGLRNYIRLSEGNGKCAIPKSFLKGQAKYLPKGFRNFWAEWVKVFTADKFRNTWLMRFNTTVSVRFPQLEQDIGKNRFHYRLDMTRDGINYKINPHTDSVAKVLTILYYLPVDNRNPELGTVAFTSKSGLKDDGRGMTWQEEQGDFKEEFTPIKQGAFIPNTVFAFTPCTSSWHGVYYVPKHIQRDTLQGFISVELTAEQKSKRVDLSKSKIGDSVKAPCVSIPDQ